MKSLDEILTSRSEAAFQQRLATALNPESWTKENRNDKLDELHDLTVDMADNTESFVKEILEAHEEEKSILWWKIYQEFLYAQYEFLTGLRTSMDSLSEEQLKESPLDYDWITESLRMLAVAYAECQEKVEPMFELPDDTEEV